MNFIFAKLNNIFHKIAPLLLSSNGEGAAKRETTIESSDISGFIVSIANQIKNFFVNIYEHISNFIGSILYLICKLCLNIVDFLQIFIKEFSGTTKIDSYDINTNFEDMDILFKFLLNKTVIRVIYTFLGLAFVLLIIFTIVAIIRNQWKAVTDDEDIKLSNIFSKSLKAIFLFIMVPLFVVFGVFFSNVILTSGINAIQSASGTTNLSIGGEVFVASTYQANQYRNYANEGYKIPIYYYFDGSDSEIISNEDTKETDAVQNAYLISDILNNKNFYRFEDVQDSSQTSDYYTYFDGEIKTKKIEYYVMADFIDYAMRTGYQFKIMSVEDVYNSVHKALANIEQTNYSQSDYKSYSGVQKMVQDSSAYIVAVDADRSPNSENIDSYRLDVNYSVKYTQDEPDIDGSGYYGYYSKQGTSDEVNGTKYIVCIEMDYKYNNDGTPTNAVVYLPFTNGSSVNGIVFESSYLKYDSVFLFRGLFTDDGYPTAVRSVNGNVECYRYDLKSQEFPKFLPVLSYDETSKFGNILGGASELLTGYDISKYIPKVTISNEYYKVFNKNENIVASLDDSTLYLNYNFSQSGYNISNTYVIGKIHYIILVFASLTFVSIFFKIIIGLVKRLYELTLLFMTYPMFLSSFPIDDGSRFKKWTENFIKRVISIYSIYLSLELVMLIFPLISKIELFNEINFEGSGVIAGVVNSEFSVDFVNGVTRILLTLVLFSLFSADGGIITLVQEVLENNTGGSVNLLDKKNTFSEVFGKTVSLATKAVKISPVMKVLSYANPNKIKESLLNNVPGGAFINRAKTGVKNFKDRRNIKKRMEEIKNGTNTSSS